MRSLALALLLAPTLALAQAAVPAPRLLPYQGRLLKADGTPETGSQWLTFRIYATADATDAVWTEGQSVPLTNGFYAVFLGAVSVFPDNLFDGHDRWLGVTVGNGPELAPRQQMASVAYAVTSTNALRAATADQATHAANADHATAADRSASADYAARAGTAANADTATRTTHADRATLADSATTATTALSFKGGQIEASTVHATDGVTTEGPVSALRATVSQDLLVGGNLQLTGGGRIVGDGFRIVGIAQNMEEWISDQPSTFRDCTAMGDGACGSDSKPSCARGDLLRAGSEGGCSGHEGDGDHLTCSYRRHYFCVVQ